MLFYKPSYTPILQPFYIIFGVGMLCLQKSGAPTGKLKRYIEKRLRTNQNQDSITFYVCTVNEVVMSLDLLYILNLE